MPEQPKVGGIPARTVVIGGVLGVGAYFVWRWWQGRNASASSALAGGSTIPGGGAVTGTPATPTTLAAWQEAALAFGTDPIATLNAVTNWLAGNCVDQAGYGGLTQAIQQLGLPPGITTFPVLTVCPSGSSGGSGAGSGAGGSGTSSGGSGAGGSPAAGGGSSAPTPNQATAPTIVGPAGTVFVLAGGGPGPIGTGPLLIPASQAGAPVISTPEGAAPTPAGEAAALGPSYGSYAIHGPGGIEQFLGTRAQAEAEAKATGGTIV